MFSRISILVLLLVSIWVYLRYFERKSIYFPIEQIAFTPKSKGLVYDDVFFKTADKVKINGWFIPTRGSNLTLLFCHGNAGNISYSLELVELFNQMGINVFIFDYRGYGKSNGTPSERGTYLDAQAAFDYLCSRKDVNKENIIIYGNSLGGAVAVDLAQKVKAKALIIDSTFTSSLDVGREIYPFLPVKLMITMKYDTLSKIDKIDFPKLIIHSRDDEMIPFHHGQQLFERAIPPKEFYEIIGSHNEAVLLIKDEFQDKVRNFLIKYNVI